MTNLPTPEISGKELSAEALLANNYGPAALTLVSGAGTRVMDNTGREYLDFGSGISVTSFGHCHAAIRNAAVAQMDRLFHASNLFYTEPSLQLAAELVSHSFARRVFFCNSGAEANEAAIKTVRKAASATRPPDKRNVLTFRGGFHGRTLATVTATAQEKYQRGFEPLPAGFRYCAFNDIEALRAAFDDSICAVLFEPIQGEGGIHVASPEFVGAIRELARTHQASVVVDEVQCGMARTGKLWAHQWYPGFVPDAMTTAKALGGGLPIGALLIGETLQDALQPGSHGSTFGGNPVCCAAALVAHRLAADPRLQSTVVQNGKRLERALQAIQNATNIFAQVRGRGLMLGAQLREPCTALAGDIVTECRRQGLLILQAGDGVLRFLPPLTVTGDEIDEAAGRLERSIRKVKSAAT